MQLLWRRFRNRRQFLYPLEHIPRVAVVGLRISHRSVRSFGSEDHPALRRYRPEAVAAPIATLRRWARRPDLMVSLTHAVIAYSTAGDPVTPADRDLLWHTFQVPIFEQRLNSSGEIEAWECQAHEALHLVNGRSATQCACGSPGELLPIVATPEPVKGVCGSPDAHC